MPSLLEALSNGFDTVGSKTVNGDFTRKLNIYRNKVVDDYMKYNIDLNKSIAKIAKNDNLNDDQIQRIVEEVNNQVYLIKYNQMKNSPDRDVVFDLASLKKIKEEVTGNTESVEKNQAINQEAGLNNNHSLEKKASWEDNSGDMPNMFNSLSYEFGSLSPELKRTKDNIKLEEAVTELQAIDQQINKYVEKVASSSHTVANALIQYSVHGLNAQNIFDEVCKRAECNPKTQLMIKTATENQIAIMKEAKTLPDNYELKLDFVDTVKESNEFSLKQYSFMKEAEFVTSSNQTLPVVITDEATIRNIVDLVQQVNDISTNTKAVKDNLHKKDDLIKSAGITEDQAEKIASAGKGIIAFGKALTGSNVRKAKKGLKDTTESLSKKINDDRLVSAKKTLDTLTKAKRNVDIHPRMEEANEVLNKAFNKYDGVTSKADKVINENALKGPLNPSKYFSPSAIKAKLDLSAGKQELKRAQNMTKQQTKRIKRDLVDQIDNAQRKLSNIENEIDIEGASKAVKDAEKAYNKAIASRKKARGAALVGTGVGIGLNEAKKRKQKQNSGIYY